MILLLLCLQGIRPAFAQTEGFSGEKLEQEVKLNLKKAYAASVRIVNLDANQQAVGGYFSGVVVDADGYILTAAHAVKPNGSYLVTFPDGRSFKAKGLGVIHSIDAAMMQISDKGKWPFAKMGWTAALAVNVPCVSISYPGSFYANKPTLRFGYVAEMKHNTGFMRSTCLMEPGDSGGPLFDLKGRVIGIHSRVSVSVTSNMEVPIDEFRKYWTALKTPAVHTSFIPEDKVNMKKNEEMLIAVSQMPDLISNFKEQDNRFQKNVFTVLDSNQVSILAALVDLNGLVSPAVLKGKSFFISKSSMVGPGAKVEMVDGSLIPAKVIRRDEENDLVLLQIPQEIGGGINLNKTFPSYTVDQLGNFLISPKPKASGEFSVLGNVKLGMPKSPARYLGLGVSYNQDDYKIVVTGLFPTSVENEKSEDIAVKDVLTKINDRPLLTINDLPEELSKFELNQSITLEYAKGKAGPYTKTFVLKLRDVQEDKSKDLFLEGKSSRRDNFKEVLVHDAKLKPSECGGPLFDLKGDFYGINIARLSRTSSLAIPAPVVLNFVKGITAF
ncbi:trypsin-like peptidase domain-containing protein [Pedobacter gandavensis]|uniref:trypsin-like peptidase domain-containing protein n=1 Tax=Pedobacter gandavensis TaxID=2679963 RepID=UPI00293183E3|nr:trypsin-like peptidase domain-containing protein [Pedobacter gandavensis]